MNRYTGDPGMVLSHLAAAMILLGLFVTALFRQEGLVELKESEPRCSFTDSSGSDRFLGFSLRLDHYGAGPYAAGDRSSSISIVDNGDVVMRESLEAGKPLAYGRYVLYQADLAPGIGIA